MTKVEAVKAAMAHAKDTEHRWAVLNWRGIGWFPSCPNCNYFDDAELEVRKKVMPTASD